MGDDFSVMHSGKDRPDQNQSHDQGNTTAEGATPDADQDDQREDGRYPSGDFH